MCANIPHMEFGFLDLRKWVTTLRYCTFYGYVKPKGVVFKSISYQGGIVRL